MNPIWQKGFINDWRLYLVGAGSGIQAMVIRTDTGWQVLMPGLVKHDYPPGPVEDMLRTAEALARMT